jgi:hypothetical protein
VPFDSERLERFAGDDANMRHGYTALWTLAIADQRSALATNRRAVRRESPRRSTRETERTRDSSVATSTTKLDHTCRRVDVIKLQSCDLATTKPLGEHQ